MNLYFIAGQDADGNCDLLVEAESPEEAEGYWREYFTLNATKKPARIFHVQPSGNAGAIMWFGGRCTAI